MTATVISDAAKMKPTFEVDSQDMDTPQDARVPELPVPQTSLAKIWLPEICWYILSLLCFVVITVTLANYDGKDVPTLPAGMTLNGFVALFVSLAKLALLVPIVEGLGQLRWLWFSDRERKISDFEAYEQACRGTFGALRLLFTLKGGVLGALAAIVTISSLLISPLSQQMIHYPTRLSAINDTASIPWVTRIQSISSLDGNKAASILAMNTKRHVLTGAYTPPDSTLKATSPVCSTGECVFPDFVSIGICSDVADITKYLNATRARDINWGYPGIASNTAWTATLPGGHTLTIPTLHGSGFFSGSFPNDTLSFSRYNDIAMGRQYIIYSNFLPKSNSDITFHAAEIVWYWCTKALSLKVTAGVPEWKELAQSAVVKSNSAASLFMQWHPQLAMCIFGMSKPCADLSWGELTLEPPAGFESPHNLTIGELAGLSISTILFQSFWNGLDLPLTEPMAIDEAKGATFMSLGNRYYRAAGDMSLAFGLALWPDVLVSPDPQQQIEILRNLSSNIAKGLENYYREEFQATEEHAHPINGTVLGRTPYVEIRWPWLCYLALELLFSAAFLVGIILATRRTKLPVLKSSALATLCAVDDDGRNCLGNIGDFEHLKRRAEKTYFRLGKKSLTEPNNKLFLEIANKE